MVELDLFKLHDEEEDKRPLSWICVSGKDFSTEVQKLLNDLYLQFKRKELDLILVSQLGVSKITATRLRRKSREWYPLVFLQTILDIWKKSLNRTDEELRKVKEKLLSKIELIKCNNGFSKPLKAVKKLTIELCKITGAYAADGTLHNSLVRITDGDKQAVEAFKGWVENTFEIKLSEVKSEDGGEWSLTFRNKVIGRYLNKFFDFPSGPKTYSVDEPKIIKKSTLKFRKAFVLGVLTFDAGIGIKPKIEFCVSSKKLRDSICEILKLLGLEIRKGKSRYWRFWTSRLDKNEALKWIELFEPGTEKWFKIYEIARGFQGRVSSINDVSLIFSKVYPTKSASKISLNDIFHIISRKKEIWRYKLVDLLKQKNNLKSFGGKWAHSVSHYLNILKAANIISVEKRKFGNKSSFGSIIREVYKLNRDVSLWKVPFRPWLRKEVNYNGQNKIEKKGKKSMD